MERTRIKIDGVCRVEDAAAATRAGVDAIGIVLDPTAGRYVPMDEAVEIARGAGALVTKVGVFVNQSAEEIREAVAHVGLDVVQLHGEETAEGVRELGPLRVIKAVHLGGDGAEKLRMWREAKVENLMAIIVESPRAGNARGGTGVASDFAMMRQMMDRGEFDGLPAVIIAGGLTPENVGGVVRNLRPYGVDVSSGVEGMKRVKSVEKMLRFARAVREADGGRV